MCWVVWACFGYWLVLSFPYDFGSLGYMQIFRWGTEKVLWASQDGHDSILNKMGSEQTWPRWMKVDRGHDFRCWLKSYQEPILFYFCIGAIARSHASLLSLLNSWHCADLSFLLVISTLIPAESYSPLLHTAYLTHSSHCFLLRHCHVVKGAGI